MRLLLNDMLLASSSISLKALTYHHMTQTCRFRVSQAYVRNRTENSLGTLCKFVYLRCA